MHDTLIVTGGAGFIGSHLVDALVAGGSTVHVLDDLSTGRAENVHAGAQLHRLDIRDGDALTALARTIGPVRAWFHLAAQADVRVSVADPVLDASVNVIGTLNVIAAAGLGEAPVVFTSTGGAMYGAADTIPTSEDAPARPEAPYGAAKLAAEQYLAQDARLNGAPHVVTRLANVYGPRQDPHGEAGVVAIFHGRISKARTATIYGDGMQTRDYVYVADVVEALLAAADAALDGRDSTLRADGDLPIYNVGTGTETSVLELWSQIEQTMGTSFGVEHADPREGELSRSALDPTRARTALGVPMATTLEQGLASTCPALA